MDEKLATNLQVLAEIQKARVAETLRANEAERTAKLAVRGLIGVVGVSLLCVGIGLARLPLERYLYSDNAKAICEAQLQSEPLITANTVLDFAKDCVLDMDTFAHYSVEKDLSRMAERCLTPDFRRAFFKAPWLKDRIQTVQEGYLRVAAQTTGPVLMESSGPTAEGYKWTLQVPVKRTFLQGDAVKGSNQRMYRVDVYRVVRNAYNPVGLGINRIEETSQ